MNKFNAKTFTAIVAMGLVLLITLQVSAIGEKNNSFLHLLTSATDTTPIKKIAGVPLKIINNKTAADTTKKNDTIIKNKVDTFYVSKDSLQAPVHYSAEDSGVLIITTKEFILYGKARTT
ncbi:MAG: hypothetical protein H7178_13655 [Chitinophagaceae bacterium]|nr:hypothetical protein [Chitinophagaceae bacterium]